MSGVPPGGKVTITRTGFDGKPCAHAADERTASTASAMIVLRNIYDPPRDLGLADGERIAPNTTPPAARAPLLRKGGDGKEKGGPFLFRDRLRGTNESGNYRLERRADALHLRRGDHAAQDLLEALVLHARGDVLPTVGLEEGVADLLHLL